MVLPFGSWTTYEFYEIPSKSNKKDIPGYGKVYFPSFQYRF